MELIEGLLSKAHLQVRRDFRKLRLLFPYYEDRD